jgi:hypothetical protein
MSLPDDMYGEKQIPTGANFQNIRPMLERINEIVTAHTEAGEADDEGTSSTEDGTTEP